MLKIRRPLGRLIFNMGIAIPGKTVFLIETTIMMTTMMMTTTMMMMIMRWWLWGGAGGRFYFSYPLFLIISYGDHIHEDGHVSSKSILNFYLYISWGHLLPQTDMIDNTEVTSKVASDFPVKQCIVQWIMISLEKQTLRLLFSLNQHMRPGLWLPHWDDISKYISILFWFKFHWKLFLRIQINLSALD